MHSLSLIIRTKTPLWTGDINQKCSSLQPAGIIGSLRWWTEVIIRSIDRYACDPTSDGKCPKDDKDKKHYCPACLIFGATGIRRAFRLNINGGRSIFSGNPLEIKPLPRNRRWYLGSGIVGEITLEITPLDKDFDESLALVPLILASEWGGIGAKTQHGYGVVEIEDCPKVNLSGFKNAVEKITSRERLSRLKIDGIRTENDKNLPNLKDMFFAKIQFEVTSVDWWKKVDGIAVQIAPAIKNWLRYKGGRQLWSSNRNQDKRIENWLFGTAERVCATCYERVNKDRNDPRNFWCRNCRKSLKNKETFERVSSKINISCAYQVGNNLWEYRIWGWIPVDNMSTVFDRNYFLNNLSLSLNGKSSTAVPWIDLLGDQTKNHKLEVWREYNSSRDTITPNERDISNYLQSLLEGRIK